MLINLLWKALEHQALENCLVNITATGAEIVSTIIGMHDEKIYKVDYQIGINSDWEMRFAEIKSRHSDQQQLIKLENDGNGNWLQNGKPADAFNGCTEIDIPLTPFTNTLPINRLKLAEGTSQLIDVIYIDLAEQQIKRVQQKYTRLSRLTYRYENVPNDFEATIEVDNWGFVVDYPLLFTRIAAAEE